MKKYLLIPIIVVITGCSYCRCKPALDTKDITPTVTSIQPVQIKQNKVNNDIAAKADYTNYYLLAIALLTGIMAGKATNSTNADTLNTILKTTTDRLPFKQKVIYTILKWVLHSRRKVKK